MVLLCTLYATPSIAADRVRLETSQGTIVIQLFAQQAPATVANFLKHVEAHFYDGLIFHRVVANFVIQAGGFDAEMKSREPLGTAVNEAKNGLRNERGTVAMARTSNPDSADSQFYINMRTNTNLDRTADNPGYTVFGRVIEGMDVAEMIELSETGIRSGMAAVPITPVIIRSASIDSAGEGS
ncbi:MAG: peptidyl-prolyl cis-trans isomerase [Gammaproteobacteria bacterium]|nr:peptidyl-prolyl cis-trans isomerase [Gammaproteobacteria bacterium]